MGELLSGLGEGGNPANFTLLLNRVGPEFGFISFEGLLVLSPSDLHTKVVPNIKTLCSLICVNKINGGKRFFKTILLQFSYFF